jgi:hypothetical protein
MARPAGATRRPEDSIGWREDSVCQREDSIGWREDSVCQREDSIGWRDDSIGWREDSIGQREDSVCQREDSTCQLQHATGRRPQPLPPPLRPSGGRDVLEEPLLRAKISRVRRAVVLFASALSAGCAPSPSNLDARIHDLELQVAQLRAEVNAHGRTDGRDITNAGPEWAPHGHGGGSPCVRVLPAPSIPDAAQMTNSVPFDLGQTSNRGADRITITDVHGTQGDFAIGGSYVVRGQYTLASTDEADLAFYITAIDPADGCGDVNRRQTQHVTRGSGTFELANTIGIRGYPHVTFYVGGASTSGVYFGKGDFLQR